MPRKLLSLVFIGLLMQFGFARPAAAASGGKAEKEAQFVKRVREGIAKLGVGEEARIEVKLRDATKLNGYVGEANVESFTVVDAKTGTATRVAYAQVKGVKGNNLSEGAKIAIGVGALILLAVILLS